MQAIFAQRVRHLRCLKTRNMLVGSTTRERVMTDAADLGALKIEDFSPHLNTGFEIQLPDGKSVQATLAEAAANGTAPPVQGLTGREGQPLKARAGGGFTLQFVTPENAIRSQGIYSVKHPKLGACSRFSWCPAVRWRRRALVTTRCSDKTAIRHSGSRSSREPGSQRQSPLLDDLRLRRGRVRSGASAFIAARPALRRGRDTELTASSASDRRRPCPPR